MPLYGRKVFHQSKPLVDVDPNETIYTIPHTQEQFRSKAEYEKRLSMYEDPVWTCQCTGHINLTHEEAYTSEQEKKRLLKQNFPEYFNKTVLSLVHHSTEQLDTLVDKAWTKIQEAFVIDEVIALKVKANGKILKGKVVHVDTSDAEKQNGNKSCNSPSSDKENTSGTQEESGSPKKWVPPKLLPYKYNIRLEEEGKIISSIPVQDLQRTQRTPSKELVKLFVRANALRTGNNQAGPWVVDEELVAKYQLPSKFADFFLSVHKMAEAGKKSTEINHKKRKLSDAQGEPPAKKPRGRKSVDKKETKQKKVSLGKNTPSKSASPKKKVASPKKKDTPKSTPQKVITIDSDESDSDSDSDSDDDEDDDDDEMTLAQIQRSPSKTGTPRKSLSGTSSKQSTPKKRSPKKAIDKVKQGKKKQEKKAKEKQQDNPSPRKRGRPRKEEQVVKSPGKRGRPRKTDTPKKESPKKGAKSPGKQGKQSPTKKTGTPKQKNLKQMTLFDMKKGGKSPKKGNKPASPTKIPKVVVNMEKAMKDGDKTLIKQLSKKAARDLSAQQRNKLPPGKIRDLIMQSFEALEDRKKMKSMTAEQKEEYLRQRKADKKRQQALERRRANKKVEDTVLDLQPLPTPKLVPTPDGIVNEMFGEVAMVTEFLSCFKGLLMPDDDCPIVADALMKALAADAEGFSYLNHTLGILLQTLLQDGIAEDYKELTMPVSSIAVNPHTVSELVRLVLRKHDSGEDHDDASSDNSDELLQEEEVPEDLVELLETTELFKLDPQQKLQILSGLCHRIMGSYSVQGYMETKQHEAGQLWKQKIAELKEAKQKREVEKKENKEKKKEQKGKKSDKEDEESTEAKPQGVTLLNFYSKENADSTDENQVHDEDLASIVKRRRVMAAKAAAEKEQKEKEDKIRREKEAEEWRKEKEKESFEKAFNEGLLAAKLALRHQSIGTDRNHSRYWIFNNAVPGLYVEKGWAHKDMTYTNRKPGESSDSSDSDFSDSDDEPLVQKKKMGRPKKNKDEEEELTFPHSGQNLWFMYDTVKELDQLMESLHTQGIRESALKGELSKQHVALTKAMSVVKKANNESNLSNGEKEVVEGFRSELLDIETRLRNGGLGGVDEFQGWEQRLQKATTIEEFGQCLIETQSFIMNKFCLGMMMKKKIKVKATEVKEETEEEKTEDGEEQVKKEDEENGTEVTVKEEEEELEEDEEEEEEEEEEDEDTSENFVAPMVAKWKEAIQNCQTFSRLHVLMSIMDACIKWEKSAENAKCKVCRKKGDDAKLLLCDECNQAFHLYCLRPSLLEVPRGDWFCPACVPTTRRLRGRTDYRKMADYSSSEEDSDESIQHEDECAVCGGDEGLIFCNSCPSAFHLDCHEPPLRHQPRSTWSCVQCKTGVRIRSKRKALEAKSRTRRRVYEEDDDWTNKPQPKKARPPPSLRSSPPQQASRTSQSSRRTSQTTMAVNGVADHQKESPVLGNRSTRRQMSNVGSVFAGGLESVTADKRSRSSDRADANRLKHELQVALDIIQRLNKNRYSWPFRQPVDAEEVPDYYQVVKNPIDLMTIRHKCQSGQYSGVEEFLSDMALMFDNAFLYNKAESEIGVIAAQFEKAFIEQLNRYVPGREYSRLVQTTSAVLDDHAYCTASKSDSSMEM